VHIVGVLNVTPDSFHDGGRFTSVEDAVHRAGELIAQGADIVEIGGESTGPHSAAVSTEEEMVRVLPVLEAIRSAYPQARLSIDTYKSAVAAAAIKRGVIMVNDVTAGRADPDFFSVVAASKTSLVLMYSKDANPRTTLGENSYTDVIQSVSYFLRERRDAAAAAGIDSSRIILDPGLGHFVSSDPQYSFEILGRLQELLHLECPLFISPSRKSFLAGGENLQTADRLSGTIAASAIAVLHGATYIRTHDVVETRRACEIAQAIRMQNSRKE
jgi:dihydropteroate synthase